LLLGNPLTPEQQQYVTAIQASGDALLTLINDILDLSKIEAGHLSLEVQPLDLCQLVSEVVDVFTAQVRAKGLDISAHVDPAAPAGAVGRGGGGAGGGQVGGEEPGGPGRPFRGPAPRAGGSRAPGCWAPGAGAASPPRPTAGRRRGARALSGRGGQRDQPARG